MGGIKAMPYPIGAVQRNRHITPVEGGINVVPLFGLQAGVETGSAFVGAIIDFVLCLNAQKRVVQVIGQKGACQVSPSWLFQ